MVIFQLLLPGLVWSPTGSVKSGTIGILFLALLLKFMHFDHDVKFCYKSLDFKFLKLPKSSESISLLNFIISYSDMKTNNAVQRCNMLLYIVYNFYILLLPTSII